MSSDAAKGGTALVFTKVGERVLGEYPGDEPGKMLHSTGLKTNGMFYAFASSADVVVKLPAPRVAELVGTGRGSPCETRPGRPMKEWVVIPSPDEDTCRSFVLEARAFVASLPPKKPRR